MTDNNNTEEEFDLDTNGSSDIAKQLDRFEEAHSLVNGFMLHLPKSQIERSAQGFTKWTNETEDETSRTFDEVHEWLKENNELDEEDFDYNFS